MPLTLLTGPVRSGKSAFAQALATQSGLTVRYVATARHDPDDAEWEARLARHAHDRPSEWTIVETASMTAAEQHAFFGAARTGECLIVDSLGTWLACAMNAGSDTALLEAAAQAFGSVLLRCKATVIVVGEQVGWDVVPTTLSARVFRDILGRMQQRLATQGDRAFLVVAGHAIDLHAAGRPIA